MKAKRAAVVISCALLLAMGATAQSKQEDVCRLLTASVIQKAQGSAPVTTRATATDTGKLKSEQCFFELTPFAQSISLQVISPSRTRQVDVREFWNGRFHRLDNDAGEAEEEENLGRAEAEAEHQTPPVPLKGVGDEAYWVDTGRDGALYALAGENIVRISLGGNFSRDKKIEKASLLANSAIARLGKSVASK